MELENGSSSPSESYNPPRILPSNSNSPTTSLRPKPLKDTFWAFLNPPVPLVPSVPSDVSDTGKSPATDASLYPSDEELTQRALWHSFLVVLGWSFLALVMALPLYMVNTPCVSQSLSQPRFGGGLSTMQDLSLLRLLNLLDDKSISTSTSNSVVLSRRATVDGRDVAPNTRTRIIILTVLFLVLGILPALYKTLKEFNLLLSHRLRWLNIKLEGKDMGWLSLRQAPGFTGWGEKRVKDFINRTGLSSALETSGGPGSGVRRRRANSRGRELEVEEDRRLSREEELGLEVDVQSLFTIV